MFFACNGQAVFDSKRTETKQCSGDADFIQLVALESASLIAASVLGNWFMGMSLPWIHNKYLQYYSCMLSVVREPKNASLDEDTGNLTFIKKVGGKEIQVSDYADATEMSDESDFLTICNRFPPFKNLHLLKDVDQDKQDDFLKNLKEKGGQIIIDEEKYDLGKLIETSKSDQYQNLLATAGELKCSTGSDDNRIKINGLNYHIRNEGSKICAFLTGFENERWIPEVKIGCHRLKTQENVVYKACKTALPIREDADESGGKKIPNTGKGTIIQYDNSVCYKQCNISKSCFDLDKSDSRIESAIVAPIMQCITESIDITLTGNTARLLDSSGCKGGGLVRTIQEKLRKTVMAVITLAISFFGLKFMISGKLEQKEVIVFCLKIGLIAYFCMPGPNNGVDKYYHEISKLKNGLINIVLNSSGNPTICQFETSEYIKTNAKGQKEDNSYMALWDQLDCRLFAYMGGAGIISLKGSKLSIGNFWDIFTYILAFLFFNFLAAIMILAITLMLIIFIMWILEIYIVCMFGFALLAFLSPIFIPMMLFQYLKPNFDNWLKEVVAFNLFPLIIFIFTGYILTALDIAFFGDVQFEEKIYINGGGFEKKRFEYDPNANKEINDLDPRILAYKGSFIPAGDQDQVRNIIYSKMFQNEQNVFYFPKGYNSLADYRSKDYLMSPNEDVQKYIREKGLKDLSYDELVDKFKENFEKSRDSKITVRLLNMEKYLIDHWLLGAFKMKIVQAEGWKRAYGNFDLLLLDLFYVAIMLLLFLNFLGISAQIAGELSGGSRAVIEVGNAQGLFAMAAKVGKVMSTGASAVKNVTKGAKKAGGKIMGG